jgi:glutamate---cysteine ligase / carboxylate-amine ligase
MFPQGRSRKRSSDARPIADIARTVRSCGPREWVLTGIATRTPNPSAGIAGDLRALFDRADEFTVGVEEELLIVDPVSFELVAAAPRLLAEVLDDDRFRAELSPAQIEIVSPVCTSPADAVRAILAGRREASAALAGEARLAGLATHPFAEPWSGISPGPRFELIELRFRWAARQGGLAAGLHVHVAVPGADTLLAVYNALRGYMPELAALAAAAPFFAGRDTGLASIRPKLADALPNQGVAPAFAGWGGYASLLSWGRRTGSFPDHTKLWWECRLHPGFGTIEMRVPDAQSAAADVETVATVAWALARWLAERYARGEPLPAHPAWAITENRWRAAADGVEGELVDLDLMRPVATRARIRDLLSRIGPHAGGRAAEHAVERALIMLERPASRVHRDVAAARGLPGLVAWAADRTERNGTA